MSFTYRVNVPEGAVDAVIDGALLYRTGAEELEAPVAAGASDMF